MEISVLGTTYTINKVEQHKDAMLTDNLGYCDKTIKRIVVQIPPNNGDINQLSDIEDVMRTTIRHELVHAFLFESGLDYWSEQNEDFVQWIAAQMPKMIPAMQEAGGL